MFVKRRRTAPGPSSELSEELAVGVEPAALDVRVAPECPHGIVVLASRSSQIISRKRGRQDVNGPQVYRRLDSEFPTLTVVSGLAASYSSGLRMPVRGPWGAQTPDRRCAHHRWDSKCPRPTTRQGQTEFDALHSSSRHQGIQVRTQRPARRSSPFSPAFQAWRNAVDGR